MLLSRLPGYSYRETPTTWSATVGNPDSNIEITVYLDLMDAGAEQFLNTVYEELFTTRYDSFDARVDVYPVAQSRLSRLQTVVSDVKQGRGKWVVTPGIASELAITVCEYGSSNAMMTFMQRLVETEAVNTFSVKHVSSYLSDLDVSQERVLDAMRSAEYLPATVANSGLWASELQLLADDPVERKNNAVFVNGMCLDEVTVDAVQEVSESVPTLTEIAEAEASED